MITKRLGEEFVVMRGPERAVSGPTHGFDVIRNKKPEDSQVENNHILIITLE